MQTTITRYPRCSAVLPGQGEILRIFDEEFVVQVTGADTNGAYAIATGSVAPGGGPPLHAHPGNETFYVLSGEFEFTQRDEEGVSRFRGGPGTVVHAPAHAPHRFENVSPSRSQMMVVVSAEAVDFLRELAAAFPPGSEPNLELMLDIHEKYEVETFHGEEGSRAEPARDGATSARARMLAWRFERANAELIATIESCSDKSWRLTCADTGWSVGVQADHIAVNEGIIAGVIRDAAEGQPHPPLPAGKLDAINARHAAEFANVTREEVLARLRDSGPAASQVYRLLSDGQLEQSTILLEGGSPERVVDLISSLAIGEIERHGAFIREAIRGK